MGDSQGTSGQGDSSNSMRLCSDVLGCDNNMHDLPLLVRNKSVAELNEMWKNLQTEKVTPYQFNRSHLLAYIYIARKRREQAIQEQAPPSFVFGN